MLLQIADVNYYYYQFCFKLQKQVLHYCVPFGTIHETTDVQKMVLYHLHHYVYVHKILEAVFEGLHLLHILNCSRPHQVQHL